MNYQPKPEARYKPIPRPNAQTHFQKEWKRVTGTDNDQFQNYAPDKQAEIWSIWDAVYPPNATQLAQREQIKRGDTTWAGSK